MNLFVVSNNPRECAQMLDDQRVRKMATETAQQLSDAIRVRGGIPFYKKCNPNHPCTKWVTLNRSNFTWAFNLLIELNEEYRFRYKKEHGVHHLAFTKAVKPCLDQVILFPIAEQTPFQNSSLFKDEPDVFLAYKKTMIHKWKNFKREPRWTNREKPGWATDPSLLLI